MASRPDPAVYRQAHRQAVAAVRARVQAYVAAAWGGLSAWRDSDIERFVAQVVPVVLAGQAQAAWLTDAYLAGVASAVLGTPQRLAGVNTDAVTGAAVRNGTEPADVYRRAGLTVWTALAAGVALDAAVRKGALRAELAVDTDIQLAVTHTTRSILGGDDRVSGYKRTLSGRSCDLCREASQQTYRTGDLMPIHSRCSCGVEPLYGGRGHGSDDSGDVAVHEHGELGPVLGVPGQAFTGPDDF